ncbi:hypothetical protein ACLMJK_007517 [Lecanora helva]
MSSSSPKKGEYAPPSSTSVRSPCPALNTLANHGYIPRTGKSVQASELYEGLKIFGLDATIRAVFAYPIFIQRDDLPPDTSSAPPPLPSATWRDILTNPIGTALRGFGMRPPGQTNANGVAILNLDQLDIHNVVEHDVSMTRRDAAEGDNHTIDRELLAQLLASSTDGKVITLADFVELRKKRYAQQQKAHPESLQFGAQAYQTACSEVVLVLKVFGDGEKVPLEYVRAFFEEERLPREEGWSRRRWLNLGLLEMNLLAGRVKRMIGYVPPVSETTVVAH